MVPRLVCTPADKRLQSMRNIAIETRGTPSDCQISTSCARGSSPRASRMSGLTNPSPTAASTRSRPSSEAGWLRAAACGCSSSIRASAIGIRRSYRLVRARQLLRRARSCRASLAGSRGTGGADFLVGLQSDRKSGDIRIGLVAVVFDAVDEIARDRTIAVGLRRKIAGSGFALGYELRGGLTVEVGPIHLARGL